MSYKALKRQFDRTTAAPNVVAGHQFATEKIEVSVKTKSDCTCDGDGGCVGEIVAYVSLFISGRTADRNVDSILFELPEPLVPIVPSRRPTSSGNQALALGIETTLTRVPGKDGRFVEVLKNAGVVVATTRAEIPCFTRGAARRYVRRFAVVTKKWAGKKISPGLGRPDRVVLLDVFFTVTPAGQCKAKVSIDNTFMVEFEDGFDHTFGGRLSGNDAELPDVTPNYPTRGPVPAKNLLRRIRSNGKRVGGPFPTRL